MPVKGMPDPLQQGFPQLLCLTQSDIACTGGSAPTSVVPCPSEKGTSSACFQSLGTALDSSFPSCLYLVLVLNNACTGHGLSLLVHEGWQQHLLYNVHRY